jgi:hypothetical protein
MSEPYNPVQCLREEVQRFKATNTFTTMQVTGFYLQAAVVLDYVSDLEETLDELYGAVNETLQHAKRMRRWT